MTKALMIDYRYCTGCHTCEIACQQEHGYPAQTLGIVVNTIGPKEIEPRVWQFDNIPVITAYCDFCEERCAGGKQPSCVQHCQAGCMDFGELEEIAKVSNHEKAVIYTAAR